MLPLIPTPASNTLEWRDSAVLSRTSLGSESSTLSSEADSMWPLRSISSSSWSRFSLSLLPSTLLLASDSTRVVSYPTLSALAPHPVLMRFKLTKSWPSLVLVQPTRPTKSTPTALASGSCVLPLVQTGERMATPVFASLATVRLPTPSAPATFRPTPPSPTLACWSQSKTLISPYEAELIIGIIYTHHQSRCHLRPHVEGWFGMVSN